MNEHRNQHRHPKQQAKTKPVRTSANLWTSARVATSPPYLRKQGVGG
jgi:hypothetical protein